MSDKMADHSAAFSDYPSPLHGGCAKITKMTHPQCNISLVEWQVYHEILSQIRHTVFVQEQLVPVEFELDDRDANPAHVIHVIARDLQDLPIGTARMLLQVPMPRISRMAVLRAWRGQGVGRAMLEFLCACAKERGYQHACLNSQTHAVPFYYKQGFLSHGSEFLEAGIPHLEMRRAL